VIRPLRAADAAAAAALIDAMNAEEAPAPLPPIAPEAVRAAFLGRRATGFLLLALADGTPSGYLTAHISYESELATRGWYVGDIYVAPPQRRRGMGRALIAAAAARARRLGGSFLWWAAAPENTSAHAFYRALGARQEPVMAFALTNHAFTRLADTA